MNYRSRFKATMNHQQVDRPPMDLAATPMSGMEGDSADRLAEFLGIHGPYSGKYTKFDERILEALDIDFRRVGDLIQPKTQIARNISPIESIDCWGVKRMFSGKHWDIVDPPLKNASISELNNYPWPKAENIPQEQFDEYTKQAKYLYEETDYVVCAEHPVFGVMELGCWMCGYDDFLLRMALEPDFVIAFFDKILEYQMDVIKRYYSAIGPYIHLTTSGDDFGMQTGPFISADMFEELVKPYYTKRISYTKQFTDAYFFHHTCGAVFPLIPHLIDAGVDILNPIQPGAKDMEPIKLLQAYGKNLVFHGGIDTQYLLPNATPAEVENEVNKILDIFSQKSGYILAAAHNIQPDVPPENIAAIFKR
jgi:uroporphyrinogen decarboxylase